MPINTVKVDRNTVWGNPFVVGDRYEVRSPHFGKLCGPHIALASNAHAVALFRIWAPHILADLDVRLLRGKNLACWCPLDQPCHADVLLELANG